MIKALFLDYTGTIIEEGGPDGMEMLKRCWKNSDIESMEAMLAYWWKLIKNFEAVSYKDSYITEDEIVEALTDGQKGTILVKETPFYATMGGQQADKGVIESDNGIFIVGTRSSSREAKWAMWAIWQKACCGPEHP